MTYQFWYWFYRITHKLRLSRLDIGVDPETGAHFAEPRWFWQPSSPGVVPKETTAP